MDKSSCNDKNALLQDKDAMLLEKERQLEEKEREMEAARAALEERREEEEASSNADLHKRRQISKRAKVVEEAEAVAGDKKEGGKEDEDSWGDDDWGNDKDENSPSSGGPSAPEQLPLANSQNTMSSATDVNSLQNLSSGASSGDDLTNSASEVDLPEAAVASAAHATVAAADAAIALGLTGVAAPPGLPLPKSVLNTLTAPNPLVDDDTRELRIRLCAVEEEARKARDSFEVNWEALKREQARARELEIALEDQAEQTGVMERRIEDEKSRAVASEEKLIESQTQVRRLQVHVLFKKKYSL